MATNNRKDELANYTAFHKVAGKKIPPKVQALFGKAADGKKTHDEIRQDYTENELNHDKE